MDYKLIIFFLGGLGMFLFGLSIFEDSVKNLGTKTFKKLLRKYTNTNLKAVLSGTFATAILQSTSVVSLIILTFVGVGFISLQNAIGVIIGTNLGGPIMDVVLGSIGLKFNVELVSLFLIGLSGISVMIFSKNTKIKNIFKIFFGLGLLFLGLSYIKDNVMILSESFNFVQYQGFNIFFYFIVGIILTILMQSSSAMVIIVMALAGSGIIDLRIGMSIIMGAYIGTTSTAVIGSIGGNYLKKQVAFSHVFFNIFSVLMGFLLFNVIHYFIENILKLKDNVIIGLGVFAIGFKIFGTILIVPFIKQFTRFILFIIPEKKTRFGLDIEKVESGFLDLNIFVIKNDIVRLIKRVFRYNINIFDIDEQKLIHLYKDEKDIKLLNKNFDPEHINLEYSNIKIIEEKIIKYSLDIKSGLKDDEVLELNKLYNVITNVVYSAKYMKDVKFNIEDIENSENPLIHKKYDDFKNILISLYKSISQIIDGKNDKEIFDQILESIEFIKNNDRKFLQGISKDIFTKDLDQFDLSGLININRYLYLSCISIIYAVKELFLSENEKKFFDMLD
ncbi:Na/Pi symporter [Candidatus Gracilibacteria bacterium]|nr:Na/Pi symporter [Candidatus Gracilibacteria bacterium]